MRLKKKLIGGFFILSCLFTLLFCQVLPVNAQETLFFVNDPHDLTFISMNTLSQYLETYYRDMGIMNSDDVNAFYEIIRTHGAPNAGSQDSQVALVIQDSAYKTNGSGIPRGVLVIKGDFDKEKVIELLKKNYDEHIQKTDHQANFKEKTMAGGKISMHKFTMPGVRERELILLTMGNYTLISSAGILDNQLLNQTVKLIGKDQIVPKEYGESNVKYNIILSVNDKELLENQIASKYDKYKDNLLKTSQRTGLRNFFTKKIADHKVNFIKKAMNDLNNLNIDIFRMRSDSTDMKRMQIVSDFENAKYARRVKRKLLSHLNDVIKGADNPNDKLGLSSNIKITTYGNQCIIDCELGSREEQLHCFALLSSYMARAILRN